MIINIQFFYKPAAGGEITPTVLRIYLTNPLRGFVIRSFGNYGFVIRLEKRKLTDLWRIRGSVGNRRQRAYFRKQVYNFFANMEFNSIFAKKFTN